MARASGDAEIWKFACHLTARVLDFVPDADPLWPRNPTSSTDDHDRARSLADRLWVAWAGSTSRRRVDPDGILKRASAALASRQLGPPFQELLREIVIRECAANPGEFLGWQRIGTSTHRRHSSSGP